MLLPCALALAVGCHGDEASAQERAPAARVSDAATTAAAEPRITHTYRPSDADIRNPERGLVQVVDPLDAGDVAYVADLGVSLGNARIRLDRFRRRRLPDRFLTRLEAGFERIRAAGLKLVLRFQYNADRRGRDAGTERILEHIDQLTPVLRGNSDVIAVVQAGFIGAWGEWHSSSTGADGPPSRAAILRALLDALPDERMVQVRSPVYKHAVFPGGPIEPAIRGDAARVGHHHDCFLAGEAGNGTYPRPVKRWKDYVAADGRTVPVGGETCRPDPPRTRCASAEAALAAHHWSYLNRTYHPRVLASWRRGGCMGRIRRSLGHRLVLERASHPETVRPGDELAVELTIRNAGYAAPYNPRPVFLVLDRDDRRHELRLADVDPRRWRSGQSRTVRARPRLPDDLEPGTYRLSLWLPDAAPALRDRPAYAVRLANRDTWDPDTGLNVLTDGLTVAGDQREATDSSK